jgi:hypothetical protein
MLDLKTAIARGTGVRIRSIQKKVFRFNFQLTVGPEGEVLCRRNEVLSNRNQVVCRKNKVL